MEGQNCSFCLFLNSQWGKTAANLFFFSPLKSVTKIERDRTNRIRTTVYITGEKQLIFVFLAH